MSMRMIACVNMDWNLSGFKPPRSDLQRFAAMTTGGVVVMGRETWDSLPDQYKPLPNRKNVVISRSLKEEDLPDGVVVEHDLDDAMLVWGATENAWIAGGGMIYWQTIDRVDTVCLSIVAEVGGRVRFPKEPLLDEFEPILTQSCGDHVFRIFQRTVR